MIGLIMIILLVVVLGVCLAAFRGGFDERSSVIVESDRAGLVMDVGSKVKYHGLQIGTVEAVNLDVDRATLELGIEPARLSVIPSNVTAVIKPTTVFGAKYVEFFDPTVPSRSRLTAGARIAVDNVTQEINTVFENLTSVLNKIDPAKLNGVLGGLAEGLRGRGKALGDTLSDAQRVSSALNDHMTTLQRDLRLTDAVTNNLADVSDEILGILGNSTVTSRTITTEQKNVEALLLSAIGFGQTGTELIGPNRENFVNSMELLTPTTALLEEYSPSFQCLAHVGAVAYENELPVVDATGYSASLDAGLLWGDASYEYPENLPKVGAENGPGGQPGCFPTLSWDTYPAPYLRMDTGAPLNGPGTDKPKLGSPFLLDYLNGDALGGGTGRP
jgi:phospholipid/cholesterol/gamma-HCH transport system substrate-binding protein